MANNILEERLKVLEELRDSKLAEANSLKGVTDGFRVITRLDEINDASNLADVQLINELNVDVAHLNKLIDEVKQALLNLQKSDEIVFGSTFRFRLKNGLEKTKTLVEKKSERFPSMDIISINSPMGAAVLGKKVGEEFSYECPAGLTTGTILEIFNTELSMQEEQKEGKTRK